MMTVILEDDTKMFERGSYLDDGTWDGYFDELERDSGIELSDDERWRKLDEIRDLYFREDVVYWDEQIARGGVERLVCHGVSKRWDGPSGGYTDTYGSLRDLVSDTGYYGIFKDCEIDEIRTEDGDLVVTGVHHDGYVSLVVRGLAFEDWKRWEEAESVDDARAIWENDAIRLARTEVVLPYGARK